MPRADRGRRACHPAQKGRTADAVRAGAGCPARTDLYRIVLLQQDNTVCELALDQGTLRHGEKTAPLCEIELEYVAGSEDAFHALAAELADHLSLMPEPDSKLARAMQL